MQNLEKMAHPSWMTEEGLATLQRGYLLEGESPYDMWTRASRAAASHYPKHLRRVLMKDFMMLLWKGWFGLATPVASNLGAGRGLPISCFINEVQDSVDSIYKCNHEAAMLSKNGGGVGIGMSNIRPKGTPISTGGKSQGVVPWAVNLDATARTVSQSGVRRGSFAFFVNIDSPDLPNLLLSKDHSVGDPRMNIDSNIGVNVTNSFLERLYSGDEDAIKTWDSVLRTRLIAGSPYLHFIDNCNEDISPYLKSNGLKVTGTNICTEISSIANDIYTHVCCLSSMNLHKYDEWKNFRSTHTGLTAVELAIYFLDGVMSEFIQLATDVPGFEKAVKTAELGRTLGLGAFGYHGYLMENMIPFESEDARRINKEIFCSIRNQANSATRKLARLLGPCPWGMNEVRNTQLIAIAPTTSNSVIAGGISAGIEPIAANIYSSMGSKGNFIRKNPILEKVLDRYMKNTSEVWLNINEHQGSVQHLTFLSKLEKDVFKTCREINQFEIVLQVADRQKFIDQHQSVNLFVNEDVDAEWLSDLHLYAAQQGVHTLYYLRSGSQTKSQLKKLRRNAVVVTQPGCPWCDKVKDLLKEHDYTLTEYDKHDSHIFYDPSFGTVPQVTINGVFIGGYSDVAVYLGQKEDDAEQNCLSCEG